VKVDTVRSNEILRQLLFGNPQSRMLIIYHQVSVPPMMDMLSQDLVVTKLETYGTWKHVVEKGIKCLHIPCFPSTVAAHKKFISLIPWDPEVLFITWFQVIGGLCQSSEDIRFPPCWVYYISIVPGNFVICSEYRRTLKVGRLVQSSSQCLQSSSRHLKLVQFLVQETYGSPFKLHSLDSAPNSDLLI
jgi:hypothetical protein